MPNFWEKLRSKKSETEPASPPAAPPVAPPPAAPPPEFKPASAIAEPLAKALEAHAQALLLEPEEDELLLLLLIGDEVRPLGSVGDRAAVVAAARALDKQVVDGKPIAVWFGMTDFGDRIVVQVHPADSTEEARKKERSATNRVLNTVRPPTALTRKAAAELKDLVAAHPDGAADSPGVAACLEAEGLAWPIQAGMPRKAVVRALARHWGQEYVDAEEVEFPRDCKWALKEPFVRQHDVICIEVNPDSVKLAIPHPFMREVAEQVAGLTGKPVHVAMSARQDIRNRLDKLWPSM